MLMYTQMDEDCLVLNVYSPLSVNLTSDSSENPSQQLPVLVYIHGGAFVYGRGTSSALDGSELAAVTNMVVVTINYRLGKCFSKFCYTKTLLTIRTRF